jgi:hypothetical protein
VQVPMKQSSFTTKCVTEIGGIRQGMHWNGGGEEVAEAGEILEVRQPDADLRNHVSDVQAVAARHMQPEWFGKAREIHGTGGTTREDCERWFRSWSHARKEGGGDEEWVAT